MLSLVSRLGGAEDPEGFRSGLLPGLRELVPCEIAAYNEIDFVADSLVALTDPGDVVPPGGVDTFARLNGQNVLIQRYQRTRDGRPYKWSDFITRRELHRSQLYSELYKELGTEYQMAFCLPAPADAVIGLTVNREKRDFSERDRNVLNLVRSPLTQAYRTVQRYSALASRLTALERGLERSGAGVVVLSDAGPTAEFLSDDAARALGLPAGSEGRALPVVLRRWLEGAREGGAGHGGAVPPLLLEGPDDARVGVHFLPARRRGDPDALLVERADEILSIEQLRAAGLTPRQAEVLQLVARGSGNAQIASRLHVSRRTVDKHLENIYEMLGAASRTQAVLTAWSISRIGA